MMEELISILKDIKNELVKINDKLSEIQGDSEYGSLTDIYYKLNRVTENIMGCDYSDITYVCDKLDEISNKLK